MIKDKVIEFFNSRIKETEEKPNIYIKTKIVDANQGATFNERSQGLEEFKKERLEQLIKQ